MFGKVGPEGQRKLPVSTAETFYTTIEQFFETSEGGFDDDLWIQQPDKGSA
jgi:hypothetical protein